MSKFTKKCMASGRHVRQRPDCHTFLCKFWHVQMAVSQWKLTWLTPNLGILWISVSSLRLCESIVANPIIYRLVPRPSRFETRQWRTRHNLHSWNTKVFTKWYSTMQQCRELKCQSLVVLWKPLCCLIALHTWQASLHLLSATIVVCSLQVQGVSFHPRSQVYKVLGKSCVAPSHWVWLFGLTVQPVKPNGRT